MISTAIVNAPLFREDARAEKNIWIAVLEQAIDDAEALARRIQSDPSLWSNPLFRSDAKSLINYFRDFSLEPGCFGFICELMETDPEQIAKQIHEKHLRHLMPVSERPARMASISAA